MDKEPVKAAAPGLSRYPTGNTFFAWRLAAKALQSPLAQLGSYKRPTQAELQACKWREFYSEKKQSFERKATHGRHHRHHKHSKPLNAAKGLAAADAVHEEQNHECRP